MQLRHWIIGGIAIPLAGCGSAPDDPRGVQRDETLLSVSATGRVETRPDRADFQAGINTWNRSATAASSANQGKIAEIVAALRAVGILEKDIQTRNLNVQRLDWGDRKGQYQASNILNITVRDVDRAAAAVAAVTAAGANVISGPDLGMGDPERAANAAYAAAFKAARARAEAYAAAADMKIARVLSIRDGGGYQGSRYLPGAVSPSPPTIGVVTEQVADASSARLMPGQTSSTVSVQVDFALEGK